MVNLNAEMKETFSKVKLFPVATASRTGIPNVAPIAFVQQKTDDTIWLADNFMNKTLANLKENPKCAIFVYDAEAKRCFQIKGTVEVKTSGPDFEAMRKMCRDKKPDLPAKSLIIMKVTDIFECMPGPNAGKKIL